MTRSVLRYTNWTLSADPDRNPPVRHISCKECDDGSMSTSDRAAPEMWALKHSGLTGHRRYRESVTVDLVTYPTHEETP